MLSSVSVSFFGGCLIKVQMSNNLDDVMRTEAIVSSSRDLHGNFDAMKLNQWKWSRCTNTVQLEEYIWLPIVWAKHNAFETVSFLFIIHWNHLIWNYMQMNFLGNVPFLFISISEMQHGKWHFGSGLQKQIAVKWLIYFALLD